MSLVPPNFEELSNPSGSHTSHRAKSWSYQYSILLHQQVGGSIDWIGSRCSVSRDILNRNGQCRFFSTVRLYGGALQYNGYDFND